MADSIKRHNNTVRNDIYISADSAEGGNGSKDMLLSSISQALKMYPEKSNITFHVSGAITESGTISSANKNLNLTIEGDGSTSITWNFSSDVANKTCIVLSSGGGSETYNQNVTLKNISLVNKNGSIAHVEGGTLTLDNATLTTEFADNVPAINVKNGGKVVMLSGRIHNSAQGVLIGEKSTFIMESGSIESNGSKDGYYATDINGAGVYVDSDGAFYLNGGAITNNHSKDDTDWEKNGAGVCINKGAFWMKGGEISKNSLSGEGCSSGYSATGLYWEFDKDETRDGYIPKAGTDSTCTLQGGAISHNKYDGGSGWEGNDISSYGQWCFWKTSSSGKVLLGNDNIYADVSQITINLN